MSNPKSLHQLLNQQLLDSNIDCYPYSLGASRNDPPNQQILESLKQLVYKHPKWLEVARRLADQSQESYQMVSQTYAKDFIMYRSFLNSSFLRKDQSIISMINESIINVVKNGETLNNQNSFIFFQTLSMFLLEQAQEDFTIFIPYFSSQFSQFIGQYINSNSQKQMQCMLILIQKFLAYQKKNIFQTKFNQNHLDFNKLIIYVFELCLQKPNTLTLQIISTLTQKISMYDLFITHFDKIVNICEILLVQFNREMKKIIHQNPEEVINYQDDLINNQTSQTIYTEASKLIKKLVTNIDGMVLKLFHQKISQSKEVFVNDNTQNSVEKLELIYLEFLILKKAIKDRIDLIQELTEFIGDYFENIFCFREGQELLNSRLIAFSADFITEFPGKYFESTIAFLFEGIERCMDVVGLRIYQTLNTMMNQPDLYSMIQPSIQSIAPKLIANLGTTRTYHFFELFTVIIKNYDDITEKYFSRIFSSLTNKIIMEIQDNKSKGVCTTQSIKQIFKCIKILFNKRYLLEELYDSIQDTLQIYATFLQNPFQIDFEELIFDMASIIIKKGKTLTKFVLSCLQSVRVIYDKNKSLDPFFELFYELCRSATDSLLGQTRSVDFMITIMINYLQQNVSQSCFWTACYSRGCILFQLVLQHLQPLFVQGQLRQRVVNDILSISKSMEKSPHPQFVNIIITLYYISPFNIDLPLEYLKLTEYYNNKLRSLYYITKLKTSYSTEILQQALQYYKQYFHHYQPKPKQQNINPLTENQYLVDVDEEQYLKTLSIPLRQVNDITMLQQVIHELKLTKRIDIIQLSQQQRATLSIIPKMAWFGKQLRKVYKFVSNE